MRSTAFVWPPFQRLFPVAARAFRSSPSMMLLKTAAITAVYQFSFGAVAYLKQIDTLTDFAGTTNAIVLALFSYKQSLCTFRQKIITAFVVAWGARLGSFLLRRIFKWGEDRRLDNIRTSLKSVVTFWSIQGLWILIITMPAVLANASSKNPPLGVSDYVGWALYAIGFLTESIADWQKLSANPSRKWMNTGLWKYSRHPNYFGEILVWIGVYVSATPVLSGLQYLSIVSPVFTAALLLFLSGVPLLERSADKKYAKDQQYVAYKKRTSVLVPLPPAVYTRLPPWLRKTMLFDFDMYDNLQNYQNREQEYQSCDTPER
ncbi:unnamed protein product [Agarophyton chilense]